MYYQDSFGGYFKKERLLSQKCYSVSSYQKASEHLMYSEAFWLEIFKTIVWLMVSDGDSSEDA
ncbi:MAG: hypothetical protein MUF58_06845 [Arcicella sp.]|nr:hypothetical protein [Arcicella sp.]